jgi:flavin reductase (DIM6/NTAB) family NADH-FMN oxidoreductase RutF
VFHRSDGLIADAEGAHLCAGGHAVNEDAKKTALRMIPYGLYVLTSEDDAGEVSAATVSWVTQCSFTPPMVAIGVKKDSRGHNLIQQTKAFALNVLGKDQTDLAKAFFKAADKDGDKLNGHAYRRCGNGAPVFDDSPAHLECNLVSVAEGGDHDVFLGEITEATLRVEPEGRPDDVSLRVRDLGEKMFYGG